MSGATGHPSTLPEQYPNRGLQDSPQDDVADKEIVGSEADEVSSYTHAEAKRILRKVDLALIPVLVLIYLHKNMDQFIVSYLVPMQKGKPTNVLTQLKMTADDWSMITTFQTIPSVFFEVPSNLLMKKFGPRFHFTRIVLLWSLSGAMGALAKNKGGLWATRFFLGVFEAGVYPGILAHLTYWYRPDEIAVRMIGVATAASFSSIFDALLAWAITYLDGSHGISSWQWYLIILGLVGVPVAAVVWLFLPNYPETARFLSEREKQILISRLPASSSRRSDANWDPKAIWSELKNPLIYVFTGMQLFQNIGTYGLQFWLPSIIASFGFTTTQSSQLLNIPPTVVGLCASFFWAWLSDQTLGIPKPLYLIGAITWTMTSFFCLAFVKNKPALYALTIFAKIGSASFFAVLWPWRSQTMKGATSTAFVFSFQNGMAQWSGMIGPQVFRSKYAPRYTIPFMVCVIFQFLAGLTASLGWYLSKDTEKAVRQEAKIRREEARQQKLDEKYEKS
ncbi:hypothetical protein V866_000018 [Kwoniella sp. B9012]|uniref:Major facilitator superfamily (MFS) profile domain-containing protein n=1 Tax=Kwoniella europaea PYCC6329 TaxID=1423913 RepID=A0AAX4K6F8_9TREE